MKTLFKRIVGIVGTAAFGVAMACTVVAMPPWRVEVSSWDLFVAFVSGSSHAARDAFLGNLDEQGRQVFGADAWHNNQYNGYVFAQVGSDWTQVYISKPCDHDATDDSTSVTYEGGIDTGEGGGGGDGGSPLDPTVYGPGNPANPYEHCTVTTYQTCVTWGNSDLGCTNEDYLECP
jgi:hypothetical protein